MDKDRLRRPPRAPSSTDAWPWLTFWYGISWESLAVMPNWLKRVYIEKLPELVNNYQLLHSMASAYPHLDADGRKDVLRTLTGEFILHDGQLLRLVPDAPPPVKPTREQYIAALRGYGIAFEEVQTAPSTTQVA